MRGITWAIRHDVIGDTFSAFSKCAEKHKQADSMCRCKTSWDKACGIRLAALADMVFGAAVQQLHSEGFGPPDIQRHIKDDGILVSGA